MSPNLAEGKQLDAHEVVLQLLRKSMENVHVVASEPAADETTPRLAIDSANPPYTMLFRISHLRVAASSTISLGITIPVSTVGTLSSS